MAVKTPPDVIVPPAPTSAEATKPSFRDRLSAPPPPKAAKPKAPRQVMTFRERLRPPTGARPPHDHEANKQRVLQRRELYLQHRPLQANVPVKRFKR
jgi:hypothetical protein